ncbi:SDR family oxidoreductase [Sphingosinicella microcystinivorans]|uniref:SDR family oxidoreductase n=1 Tax=Sphingosinicella microcystinivorans TaxID=335406 RepID=UPI0022F3D009|nr:SDR family oxidoreductase [Sphingosinicella microcystinivorans]WBX84171.1 SDR family oxidoreductase [Sphingosinicella microcystinivorans]
MIFDGKLGSVDKLTTSIAFLASDDAAFMTGAELVVDGGRSIGTYMSFLPGAPETIAPAAFGHKL